MLLNIILVELIRNPYFKDLISLFDNVHIMAASVSD
jgi:hypothetical protein